jgi:hypothetical protein
VAVRVSSLSSPFQVNVVVPEVSVTAVVLPPASYW